MMLDRVREAFPGHTIDIKNEVVFVDNEETIHRWYSEEELQKLVKFQTREDIENIFVHQLIQEIRFHLDIQENGFTEAFERYKAQYRTIL